jgi:hypothetical protein
MYCLGSICICFVFSAFMSLLFPCKTKVHWPSSLWLLYFGVFFKKILAQITLMMDRYSSYIWIIEQFFLNEPPTFELK